MEIGETLYVTNRDDWRNWLIEKHNIASDIWLVYYNKKSGKPRIPYNDAVEEALCFGWIDSIQKSVDKDRSAQRFTPRRKKSVLSELNKERIRRLMAEGKMTPAGIESIKQHLIKTGKKETGHTLKEFIIPEDILDEIKKDPEAWKYYRKLPEHYKTIRIAYIDGARKRPEEFEKRLRYFLKMTAQNKMFGMMK